jgi:hypothetical protein
VTRVVGADRTGDCGTPKAVALPRADPLIAAAQLVRGTGVIDLTPFYCTADRCPSVIGNAIVYRDFNAGNSHVTATFMETLAPTIEHALMQALAAPLVAHP